MKHLYKLISLLLVIALTVACSSNRDDDPTITITTSEFTVGAEQDSKAVATFSVNVGWTITTINYEGDTKDWLAVTPERGGAGTDQTITIKAAANPATVERKASFSINYGGKPHKLTIKQLGKSIDPIITIENSEFTLGAEEEESEIVATFSVNVGWEISSISYEGDAKDWLTVTPTSGGAGTDQPITIKATTNPAEIERKASFSINYGGKEHKLIVTQLGKYIDPTITIENSEFTVGAEQDSEAVATFSVNVGWEISSISYEGDAKDWLTVTPTSGEAGADQTITMKASVNPAAERKASFTINYGGNPHKLTVTQEETDITAYFDTAFATKLQEKGYIPDAKKILFSEARDITEVNVSVTSDNQDKLTSLSGIEYFEALTYLNCSNNKLTTLDVSENRALTYLNCDSNLLAVLDLSKNTALTYLDCQYNQLITLDVSKSTALTHLDCQYNQLITLDVSKSTALTHLDCRYNALITLYVSENRTLTYLDCHNNVLTTLDVSKSTALTHLDCSDNKLTSLDLNTALGKLYCHNNELTTLDVSENGALTNLDCQFNKLTTLDLSKNTDLTYFNCSNNELITLDVSENRALTNLDCQNNELITLDVSNNTALGKLYCQYNKLTSLDLNTALDNLNCSNNELTALDVSKNRALGQLYCQYNKLTSLDLNTALLTLNCQNNKLPSLDISKSTSLVKFDCEYNPGIINQFYVKAWFGGTAPTGFTKYTSSWIMDDARVYLFYTSNDL